MFAIKPGAIVRGIRPEIVLALMVFYSILHDEGLDAILTEGTGGRHAFGSLHYIGCAADCRNNNIPADKIERIRKKVYDALGNDDAKGIKSEYDFVLEKDHFHLELQPKTQIS